MKNDEDPPKDSIKKFLALNGETKAPDEDKYSFIKKIMCWGIYTILCFMAGNEYQYYTANKDKKHFIQFQRMIEQKLKSIKQRTPNRGAEQVTQMLGRMQAQITSTISNTFKDFDEKNTSKMNQLIEEISVLKKTMEDLTKKMSDSIKKKSKKKKNKKKKSKKKKNKKKVEEKKKESKPKPEPEPKLEEFEDKKDEIINKSLN